MFRLNLFRQLARLGAGLALAAASTAPFALTNWATVASTGEADEASASRVLYNGQYATVKPGFVGIANQVLVRYQVHDIASSPIGPVALRARFLDSGPGSQVILALRGYAKLTGVSTLVATLNSDSFAASPAYQTQTISNCRAGLDFVNNVYYVEAQLNRLDTTGNPTLAYLEVLPWIC